MLRTSSRGLTAHHNDMTIDVIMISESDHAEPLAAFGDGVHELLDEHFLGAVVGQVQLIEAGVCAGQALLLELAMDVEALHAVHAAEVLEALHRHARAACDKLDEGCSQFHVEGLQHFEEPDDDGVVSHVVDKVGVLPEVLDIDGRPA